MKKAKLILGDNIESLKKLPDNSIDSVVTDGPYGLTFMNKKWDYDVPSIEFWKEVYRVLKPGGHALSFGGTRTYHRMVVNMEDAGFEIRDQIMWLYGSGFPKSHNIGKSVDKVEGNEREIVGKLENYQDKRGLNGQANVMENAKPRIDIDVTKGQSDWEGWGSALKPANEPICLARKPLSEKSIAENVLKWGTGGINVDGCRINYLNDKDKEGAKWGSDENSGSYFTGLESRGLKNNLANNEGRFPANIILECICDEVIKGESGERKPRKKVNDHNENSIFGIGGVGIENYDYNDRGDIHTNPSCPCLLLDEQSGIVSQGHWPKGSTKGFGEFGGGESIYEGVGPKDKTKSGASRFFYQAKVSKAERNMGLDEFDEKQKIYFSKKSRMKEQGTEEDKPSTGMERFTSIQKNNHPTVKPVALMTYLCRLITPPNGIVLDPFMGSGSTGISALLEGFRFCGMEQDSDYFKIAEARINSYEEYRKFIKK
jgi:site-specific DNA-methyltransferase (adenine-specific)